MTARMHTLPRRAWFRRVSFASALSTLSVLQFFSPSLHASRIKDLTLVEGGRDNQLIGYGLVVGLAGDGDTNAAATLRSVANVLQRHGITVSQQDIKAKNKIGRAHV